MSYFNLLQTLVSFQVDDLLIKITGGAIACSLGLVTHYGRQVVRKVDTVSNKVDDIVRLNERWGVILFDIDGHGGLNADVKALKVRQAEMDTALVAVRQYDRRRTTRRRADVEMEKERLRSTIPRDEAGE